MAMISIPNNRLLSFIQQIWINVVLLINVKKEALFNERIDKRSKSKSSLRGSDINSLIGLVIDLANIKNYNLMMIHTVNIHEAKTQLSKLIQRALNGEEVIIAKDGLPVVKLTPIQSKEWKRPTPGLYNGQIVLMPDFDDPLEEFEA